MASDRMYIRFESHDSCHRFSDHVKPHHHSVGMWWVIWRSCDSLVHFFHVFFLFFTNAHSILFASVCSAIRKELVFFFSWCCIFYRYFNCQMENVLIEYNCPMIIWLIFLLVSAFCVLEKLFGEFQWNANGNNVSNFG